MNNGPLVERRCGTDRRSTSDRRAGIDRRRGVDRRGNLIYLVAPADHRRALHAALDGAEMRPEVMRQLLDDLNFSTLEVVSRLYDAAIDPTIWPQALSSLRETMKADACALAEHDFRSGTGRLVRSVGIDPASVDSYGERYCRAAPWLATADQFSTPGLVCQGDRQHDQDDHRRSPFYGEWLGPQGLSRVLCGIIDEADGVVTFLFFARAEAKGEFGPALSTVLRRLLPGIQRAFRAALAMRRAQAAHRIAIDSLDAMPIGVAFLDSAGEIGWANKVARQIIERENVRAYRDGGGRRMEAVGRRNRFKAALIEAMAGSGSASPDEPIAFTVSRTQGLRPLSFLLSPLQPPEGAVDPDRPAALLFIADPDRPIEIDQRRLRRLYGLSRAEARVVALLAQGQKLDETAETLGLVYETVRKHLKQVFDKTGTDRQAELVRLLVTGPAGLPI